MDGHEEPQEEALPKLPFRRLKYPLEQVTKTAIPLHVRQLNELSESIDLLKNVERPLELRSEQLKASNTVRLLKQDLFELENLNRQVREEDQDQFQRTVEKSLRDAVESLSAFMSVHSDILGPFLDIDNEQLQGTTEFPEVICDLNSTQEEEASKEVTQLQVERNTITHKTADAWSFLKGELLEIHSLIRRFSSLVFSQQESIDTIQGNILQTRENIHEGTSYLKKASLLKTASIPVMGAVIGGVVLGPVGAIVGAKMFAVCVAGGSFIGYTAGNRLKKRQQGMIEGVEMKALTYPTKSNSTPDLVSACNHEQS